MAGRNLVRLLLVINVLSLGSVIVIPILGESSALDSIPLLMLPFMPFMMTWPFGPPLLLMVLLGLLGRSRHFTKIAARAIAGLLLYIPLWLTMIGFAATGRFMFEDNDPQITVACLFLAALLGWYGFTSDEAGKPA